MQGASKMESPMCRSWMKKLSPAVAILVCLAAGCQNDTSKKRGDTWGVGHPDAAPDASTDRQCEHGESEDGI